MFVRGSKRSLPHDAYKQSVACLEGLRLPFLCPALFPQSKGFRQTSSATQSRSDSVYKPRINKHEASKVELRKRSFASAAAIDHTLQPNFYIPWEDTFSKGQYNQPVSSEPSITGIRAFDPDSSPLIIRDALATYPKKFRVSKDAISGDVNEIHQTLHACLQVGRLERAAALVRRLNQIYKPDAPGLLVAHTDYISEVTHWIVQNKDQQLLYHLQRWFQVDLKKIGIEPDDSIYAMMIRASLQASGEKKERTIRRYVNLAKDAGIAQETQALLSLYEVEDPLVTRYFSEDDSMDPHDLEEETVAISDAEFSEPVDALDEVREVQIKGSGLATLKKSLSIFSKSVPDEDEDGRPMSAVERQRLLETNTVNAAIDRWRDEDAHLKSLGINSGMSRSSIGGMMWKWHQDLVPLIEGDIRKSLAASKKENRSTSDEELLTLGPYLQHLSPEKISAVTIISAIKIASVDSEDGAGVRLHNIVLGIGDGLQNENMAKTSSIQRSNKNRRDYIKMKKARPSLDASELVLNSAMEDNEKMEWRASLKIRLGALLLAHLMDIAKVQVSREDPETGRTVQELQPVLFRTYRYMSGKRVGVVKMNSTMMDKLTKVPVTSTIAKYLPMVSEPDPWVGFYEGGFLDYRVPVVRLNSEDAQSKRYAMVAAANGDMAQVFAGLDVLAKTPWKVNRFIFNTMLEAWNSGEAIAKIPPEEVPNDSITEPLAADLPPEERYRRDRRIREAENHRSGLKSQRCFQNFQLETAKAYLTETFYFPHNCDFRGRAYPMTPFLNHMGSDNVRGLLQFGRGKELTTDGLWWLKVHLANVYGYDKASFTDRLEFTDAHLPQIRESVANPLGGSRWWLGAEDPWQCLAACNELKNALELPDPSTYICHLPVHQDGTCNGLQHYAALGGDVAGARQVNLEPGKKPSDIYTAVAELVQAEISKDAGQGSPLAKELEGKVTRKVVKQTVMTNVYGVTFTGARRQVRKQLDDILEKLPESDSFNVIYATPYIARKIFAALATMFNGAHDIQHWFTEGAARICDSLAPEQVAHIEKKVKGEPFLNPYKRKSLKSPAKDEIAGFKTPVIWTTPLRMPVVQPYRKKTSRRIETSLQKISIMDRSEADPVDKAKQLQAFPPNFIHSLDATHMFLTALKCNEIGLTFASIHDSFWTHAGDVNVMNRVIRDAFIRMHSEDIVGRLAAEFKTRYSGYMHLTAIRHDTDVNRKVMAWRRKSHQQYKSEIADIKSINKLDSRKIWELLLERRRLNLLASQDPEEQEQGKQMVTPCSIFQDADNDDALAPLALKTAKLGLSPSSRSSKLKANHQIEVGDLENVKPMTQSNENEELIQASTDDARVSDPDEIDLLEGEEEEPKLNDVSELNTLSEPQVTPKDKRKTWIWLPLTFPPVPKKGDFDVKRLKDSQYFFS